MQGKCTPCIHGISPRRCGGECARKYWREAALRHPERRLATIVQWQLQNPERTLEHRARWNLKRVKQRRLRVQEFLPIAAAIIQLLPNERP